MSKRKKVFVGLSGGVDSSVAALRLLDQGYDVVGVFIKVWQPDFIDCNWEAERLDAMRVAAHLDIPFLTCDAEEAYKQEVADYFIAEYQAGRTPNPDVMCNKDVKFGAFYKFALEKGADFVATGHYAQVVRGDSEMTMLRGLDKEKDQSYFLWTIKLAQLDRILLPVGSSEKNQIRKEAEAAQIPVAAKKDSQGICFLGHIDIPEFLSHYIDLKPGAVLDQQGQIIGQHQGAEVYTTGQRHGFEVTEASDRRAVYYVTNRDIANNTITVGEEKPQPESNEVLTLSNINILSGKLKAGLTCEAQTRYRQEPSEVAIKKVTAETIELELNAGKEIATPGQSCVLYDGEVVLGGGIIV